MSFLLEQSIPLTNGLGTAELQVLVEETIEAEENISILTPSVVRMTLSTTSIFKGSYSLDIGVYVDGVSLFTFAGSAILTSSSISYIQALSGAVSESIPVPHDADGACVVSCALHASGTCSSNSGYNFTTGDPIIFDQALTTITRGTTLSVGSGTLGVEQTLAVTHPEDTYTHTITYTCGDATGTICEKSSDTEVNYTFPLDLAYQNTTGTVLSVSVSLQAYSGDAAVGDPIEQTISLTLPSSIVPACTFTVSDTAGCFERYGAYVQDVSKLNVVITGTPAYGASITGYKGTANSLKYSTQEFTTDTLKTSGAQSITAQVTDARGRSSETVSADIEVLAYAVPTVSSIAVHRCDEDGTENAQGAYVQVSFDANVYALNDLNTASYTLWYKKASETSANWSIVSLDDLENTYTVTNYSYIFPADADSAYDVVLYLEDNHDITAKVTSASTAFTLIHFSSGGKGIAFGKLSERENAVEFGLDLFSTGLILSSTTEGSKKLFKITVDDSGSLTATEHTES